MGKILYVDDHRMNHRMVEDFMERMGHSVMSVQSAQEAIHHLENHPFDLAIFDINMPVMNGLELCQWVRQHDELAELPIVILSAFQGNNWQWEAKKAGADDFLAKPVNLKLLTNTVENLLGAQGAS